MGTTHPSGLNKTQLETLKKLLDTKLAGLTTEVTDLEEVLTREENNGQGGAPDEVDRSSFEEQMQRNQLVLDGKKRLRTEVIEALRRYDNGTYGVCQESEEPVGFQRLKAQPWTRFSLEAQQEMEHRKKNSAATSSSGGYPSAYEDEGDDE